MNQTKYKDAYTEVFEILSCLKEEEYLKIPKELIQVFEENRNLEYKYKINEEQDLTKQPMLKETKAILLNLFRDYLATPEQSKKIKQWLQADRLYLEKQKKDNYSGNMFANNKYNNINNKPLNNVVSIKTNIKSVFYIIIRKIKNLCNLWR